MTSPVTAWSFSRYEVYARCPFQFKCRYIDKLPEPQAPAMTRGNEVHVALAAFLKNQGPLPKEGALFANLLEEARQMPDKIVEQQWGFTAEWKPTTWFGKGVFYRAILDLGIVYEDGTAEAIDHKTGKKYGTNTEQMELFGLTMLYKYTHLKHVTTRLWYHDSGDEVVDEVDGKDREKLRAKWEAKVAPMFTDDIFAPRPNDKCKWCHFSKSNGGPCRFG